MKFFLLLLIMLLSTSNLYASSGRCEIVGMKNKEILIFNYQSETFREYSQMDYFRCVERAVLILAVNTDNEFNDINIFYTDDSTPAFKTIVTSSAVKNKMSECYKELKASKNEMIDISTQQARAEYCSQHVDLNFAQIHY